VDGSLLNSTDYPEPSPVETSPLFSVRAEGPYTLCQRPFIWAYPNERADLYVLTDITVTNTLIVVRPTGRKQLVNGVGGLMAITYFFGVTGR